MTRTMYTIRTSTVRSLRSDAELCDKCVNVVEEAYQGPAALIASAMERNDHVLLAERAGDLMGFLFFSARDRIIVADQVHRVPYVGLVAVHPARRRLGLGRELLARFRDHMRSEVPDAERVWCVTVSPAFYLACLSVFPIVSPGRAGDAPRSDAEIAKALRDQVGSYLDNGDRAHPFVLRAARPQRFSNREAHLARDAEREAKLDVFARLAITEANGDRLLVVAHLR